ncbi:MAG: hypothetical protein A2096_13900 [Spirochaetes bacterium GWF1_41_5]|nr:MAG: hypothetical protein A2096_13900 [Spirochaetes bacterium GWF1_41_5]HBE02465.1 hypothetical protein [Spirochaetia bacterium]
MNKICLFLLCLFLLLHSEIIFDEKILIAGGKPSESLGKKNSAGLPQRVAQYYGKLIKPAAAAEGMNIIISWEVHDPSGLNNPKFTKAIAYVTSRDEGITWSPQRCLYISGAECLHPSVFVKNSCFYLFFETDRNSFYMCKTDNVSYGFDKMLKILDSQFIVQNPSAVVDNNNKIYFVYQQIEPDGFFINFAYSESEGKKWTFSGKINSGSGALQPYISCTQDNGPFRVFVCWIEKTGGLQQIFLRTRTGENEWQKEKQISFSLCNKYEPKCSYYKNEVYILAKNDGEKNLNLSLYERGEWQKENDRLFETILDCYSPSIHLINDSIYVLWTDNTLGKHDIYMLKRNVLENVFQLKKRLTDSPYNSFYPHIYSDSGKLHIAWAEENPQTPEFSKIYYMATDDFCPKPHVVLHQRYVKYKDGKIRRFYNFCWQPVEDRSGISGYCFLLDNFPDTIPRLQNLVSASTNVEIDDIPNDTWYFHLSAVDRAGNFSETWTHKLIVKNEQLAVRQDTTSMYTVQPEEKKLKLLKEYDRLSQALIKQGLETGEVSFYHVTEGDTLRNIVIRLYNVSDDAEVISRMKEIARLNGMTDMNFIQKDSLLKYRP